MPWPLAQEMVARDVAQFLVDNRNQCFQSPLFPRPPTHEQLAHKMRMLLIHGQLRPKKGYAKIAGHPDQVNRINAAERPPFPASTK